jgi:hypothetical protein
VVLEYRVPLLVLGAVMIPLGLIVYGWAASKRSVWIVTDVGAPYFREAW